MSLQNKTTHFFYHVSQRQVAGKLRSKHLGPYRLPKMQVSKKDYLKYPVLSKEVRNHQ